MRRVWFFCIHWLFPGDDLLELNPIAEVEWPQKDTEGPARQSRNGAREPDRKMGFRSIPLSCIFLSACVPPMLQDGGFVGDVGRVPSPGEG
jgi:hypothetical protein